MILVYIILGLYGHYWVILMSEKKSILAPLCLRSSFL